MNDIGRTPSVQTPLYGIRQAVARALNEQLEMRVLQQSQIDDRVILRDKPRDEQLFGHLVHKVPPATDQLLEGCEQLAIETEDLNNGTLCEESERLTKIVQDRQEITRSRTM